ncbi:MAG TPA: UbiA family prenyltransferase [Myxococcota bacterium]|nr:UbiA family prenyltransferase [Myxococcota bacterium]
MAAPSKSYGIWPYVQMARVDHWFKNAFMLLGVIVALFVEPSLLRVDVIPRLLLAFFATCIVASSNYVLNEMLDAPYDRQHPVKKHRPAAAEKVRRRWALAEWLGLGILGLGLAWLVNPWFTAAAAALWIMGILYNVKPIRTKELPYLDVLSESINNPIRLFLGWFPLIPDRVPPLSLVLSYWMVGAFFMALKRFAEYRTIGDRATAIRYRRSFAHYDEDRLLVSVFFYAIAASLFAGVFLVRYHLELILGIPFGAGLLAYYMKLGLKHDSPVQNPERLYRERGFMLFAMVSVAVFVLLMFVQIPALYDAFNVELVKTSPLWIIGP